MSVEERRATLVQAALEIAIDDGIAAVTTRNVCARANAHLSVFHYCFGSKGELIDRMISQVLLTLVEGYDASSSRDLPSLIRSASNFLSGEWDHAFTLFELVIASSRADRGTGSEPRYFQSFIDGVEPMLEAFAEREGYRWAVDTRTVAGLIVRYLAGTGIGWISDHVAEPDLGGQAGTTEIFITLIEGLQVRD